MIKVKKIKSEYILLSIILSVAIFFRFYKLPEMVPFDFDQEYAANFAYTILKEYPIQLIGQGLSVQGLFMGPLYFYFLVPFFAITSLHPIGGHVGSVVLGLTTIVFYYLIVKQVFGVTAGLTATFLRSILFFYIESDWAMVPAYSSELAILITWYCFYKYWNNDFKYLILLGFLFGLYTSFHPIQFPFYLVFTMLLLVKRKFPDPKIFFLSLVAFITPILPLIAFEYFHNFLELKLLFSLKTASTSEHKTLSTLIEYANVIFYYPYSILGIQTLNVSKFLFSVFFYLFFLIPICINVGFWKKNFHKIILSLTILTFIGYYYFLPTHVPEYYFWGTITILFLYLSVNLSLLASKKNGFIIFCLLLLVLSYINIYKLQKKWNEKSSHSLSNKDFIVKEIAKRERGRDFYISDNIDLGWQFGYSYLIKHYQIKPHPTKPSSPNYIIVYPKSKQLSEIDIESGDIGLILPNKK